MTATRHHAPLNATVEIRRGGEIIAVDPETGRLLFPHEAGPVVGDALKIELRTAAPEVIGISVDGNRDVASKKNLASGSSGRLKYRQVVVLQADRDGRPYAAYPANRLLVAEVRDGQTLLVHHYAVVGQRGELFLVQGVHIAVQLYFDDTAPLAFSAPALKDWPQLLTAVAPLVTPPHLPSVSSFQPEPEPDTSTLGDRHVLVVWYDAAWGMGLGVMPTGAAVRLHWSALPAAPGHLAQLFAGQVVSGVVGASHQSERGTTVPRQLSAIRVVEQIDESVGV